MGVGGLIVDVTQLKAGQVADLKQALQSLPRPRSRRRSQLRPIASGAGFMPERPPAREDDGDDDFDDE